MSEHVQIAQIVMRPDMVKALDAVARELDVSRSAIVRLAVRSWLAAPHAADTVAPQIERDTPVTQST